MKINFFRTSLVLIIVSAFAWQCIGAWQDSQTTDEAVHLAAGRSYWQTGDYRLNPEHPALFKLWAAWPLVFLPKAELQTDTDTWRAGNQWLIGSDYLYSSPASVMYGPRLLLLLARLPMILVWLGLVVTLAVWSWRRWSPAASLATTAALAYDPNLLGHGHLITNDVAVAFAYLGAFLLLKYFIDRPSWRRLGWLSLVFAVAQLTKFSAMVLWIFMPLVTMVAIFYRRPGLSWRWFGRVIVALIVVTSLVTWLVYAGRVNRIDSDPRITQLWQERQDLVMRQATGAIPPLIQKFIKLSDPATTTGRWLQRFQQSSIPAYWYWRGLFSATSHNYYGHAAYLLGQASTQGWWYYFPVVLYVKTPILLLLLVLTAMIIHLWRLARFKPDQSWSERLPFDFWIIGFPPLIFLLWSMTSHINIGLRHVFPTYVFFPLAVGSLITMLEQKTKRWGLVLALSTAIISLTVTTAAWPHTIGYFNGLVGGSTQGHRYVLDSNLDWNQDILRLQSFLNQQKISEIQLALFGSIPANYYFPTIRHVPGDADIAAGVRPHGVVVISDGQLYNLDGPFSWLRPLRPRWRVGSSISVYDFR